MTDQTPNQPLADTEAYRDRIATVDARGKRIWIYPKRPHGRYYDWRTYVSWLLLAVLFVTPFIKVKGDPLILLNILERKFILFGITFMPQDFHLFVFAMLTGIVFIILFTVIYGRLFCGWVCPQTIFMEMVFRKIEYWIEGDANAQRRLDAAPWTGEKVRKKTLKHVLFFAIAVLIANTFLAYIIGIDQVARIASDPVQQHLGGFLAMLAFSFVFYGVFARMREQVCIAICPYGRLQGVLLDHNSIAVMYDYVRGEPRGKMRKGVPRRADLPGDDTTGGQRTAPTPTALENISATVAAATLDLQVAECADTAGSLAAIVQQNQVVPLGDCIDCKLCVKVCPTGIDIRDGTQLECINCTACIDACDEVMDKIDRPRGLIRYDSFNGVAQGERKLLTSRTIAYSVLLLLMIIANVVLLSNRSTLEATILRTPGILYQKTADGYLSNLYNYQLLNKSAEDMELRIQLADEQPGRIRLVGEKIPSAAKGQMVEGAFFLDLPPSEVKGQKTQVRLEIYHGDQLVEEVTTSFLGPIK